MLDSPTFIPHIIKKALDPSYKYEYTDKIFTYLDNLFKNIRKEYSAKTLEKIQDELEALY